MTLNATNSQKNSTNIQLPGPVCREPLRPPLYSVCLPDVMSCACLLNWICFVGSHFHHNRFGYSAYLNISYQFSELPGMHLDFNGVPSTWSDCGPPQSRVPSRTKYSVVFVDARLCHREARNTRSSWFTETNIFLGFHSMDKRTVCWLGGRLYYYLPTNQPATSDRGTVSERRTLSGRCKLNQFPLQR